MVYYFVISADGNRYGPADIDTLVQWTREGRILGETMLVERGTERAIAAGEISAIAAEIRRSGGQAQVSVERDAPMANEFPTMTSPGNPRADIPRPMPHNPAAVKVPTAAGMPPPIPGPGGISPLHYANHADAYRYGGGRPLSSRSRVAAGLLGIFLGQLGLHRFYLGYTGVGMIMLLITVASGGMTGGASCGFIWLWGFIEGVVCLCGGMRDADGLELRT